MSSGAEPGLHAAAAWNPVFEAVQPKAQTGNATVRSFYVYFHVGACLPPSHCSECQNFTPVK